eukprot:jgi/Galph1/1527/GphlegSOOS_G207.1
MNSSVSKEEPMDLEVSKEAEKNIQHTIALVDKKPLSDVLTEFLSLERSFRLSGLTAETTRVCLEIIRLCYKKGDWKMVLEYIQLLVKRRAQVKQAIAAMVREAMNYLEEPSLEETTKLEALNTLRNVTEGKIFLELERARLTKAVAEIEEAKGNVSTAADLMEELQVETFGSMDKREKLEFILEQIRLSLDNGDYVRASVVSRKVTPRTFQEDEFKELRLRYNLLMVRLHTYNKEFWKLANEELKNAVVCLLLSPYSNEQNDLLFRVHEYKQLEELQEFSNLLELYTRKELIQWSQIATRLHESWKAISLLNILDEKEASRLLHRRTIEHNLRVTTLYYSYISMKRLAGLLDLTEEETEQYLSEQVSSQVFWARIERPSGIVHFAKPQTSEQVLNSWSHNISSLLDKVEYACHLIHREKMVRTSLP